MLFTESLPLTTETYTEMARVCSDWEKTAAAKIDKNATEKGPLFQQYITAKSVSTYSFYRFRKRRLSKYFIDIVYDSRLNLLGFALSKIITLKSPTSSKEQKLLL